MAIQPHDVDDPDWGAFTPDGSAMAFDHDTHGSHGILTIHGLYDIMHHLKEEAADEVRAWMEAGEREEELPEWLRQVLPIPEPHPIRVVSNTLPSRAFHTVTYAIPAAGQPTLVSNRSDRNRVIITNQGVNPALFSFTDDANNINVAGETAWAAIPNGALPGNPRELRSGGKIWMYSVLGTQVDLQEEYDFPNTRGGSIRP